MMRGAVKKIVQLASNFFENVERKKKPTLPIQINLRALSKSF
jgi:hypothetical protein